MVLKENSLQEHPVNAGVFQGSFNLQDTVNWGRKWLADINAEKSQQISVDRSNNTGAIDVKNG